MPLLPMQRHLLQQYQGFRANQPTVGRLLYASLPLYAFILIFFSAISVFWFVLDQAFNVWLIWGFAFGFFLRDFQIVNKSVRLWPIVAEVIDWKKVDEIVSADDAQSRSGKQ